MERTKVAGTEKHLMLKNQSIATAFMTYQIKKT